MEKQVNHARAALDVLTALQGAPAAAPEVQHEAERPQTPPTTPEPRGRERRVREAVVRAAVGREAPTPAATPTAGVERIETRPRSLARHVTGALLLFTLTATAVAGWAAWTTRDTTLGGVSLILAALTAGLWFLRVLAVPTTVSLLGPRLEITQAGRHYTWDLASPYSPVDHVRGRPGRPGWRVVLRNADGTTFAVDGSMVPAKRFTEILSRYRPEL